MIPIMAEGSGNDARRAERSRWPLSRYRLGNEPSDDLSASTTAAERIAMMWPLAVTAWKLARRPLPTYDRRTIPGALFRRGASRPTDDDA
jgi:hypothetical protein